MTSNKQATQKKVGSDNLSTIIESAVMAEKSRDVEAIRKALFPIWKDIDRKPKFSKSNKQTAAEIHRLCGVFLTHIGHADSDDKSLKKGRTYLNEAIERFDEAKDSEGAARSRVNLSWSFLQENNFVETEAILDFAKKQFESPRTHPIAVTIQIHEAIALEGKGETRKALSAVRKLVKNADRAEDPHLVSSYHILAAKLFMGINEFERGGEHGNAAVSISRESSDQRLLSRALSANADVFRRRHDFKSAHKALDEAMKINVTKGDNRLRSFNKNLQASIFFDQGEYGRALASVDASLNLLDGIDDSEGFMNAKFNKARILFKLQDSTEALMVFNEAISFARENFEEAIAREYAREFSELFYVPGYNDFHKDVAEFKKHILSDALIKSGHYMKQAARSLKISQANLSDILRRQFPELFTELGIKKRKTRTMKPKKK